LLPIIPIVLLYGIVGTALLIDWLKARDEAPPASVPEQMHAIAIGSLLVIHLPIATPVFALLTARRVTLLARLLRRVYALAIGIVFVLYVPIGAAAFAADVAIINGEMVAVAQWLDRNTPPDALIAAHDIGAIGYFTRRPLLDLAGLISPEVIPFIRDEAKLSEWMKAKGAHYLVTFPGWYPQISTSSDLIRLFAGNSPFSPEHMTVYEIER
jgi:hypothetical protein